MESLVPLLDRPVATLAGADAFHAAHPTPEGLAPSRRMAWDDRVIECLAVDWFTTRERLLDDPRFGRIYQERGLDILLSPDRKKGCMNFSGMLSGVQPMNAAQRKVAEKFEKALDKALRTSRFAPMALAVLFQRAPRPTGVSFESLAATRESLLTPEHRARARAGAWDAAWESVPSVRKPRL